MYDVGSVRGNGGPRPIQLLSCLAECLAGLVTNFLGEVSLLQGHLLFCQMGQQSGLSL